MPVGGRRAESVPAPIVVQAEIVLETGAFLEAVLVIRMPLAVAEGSAEAAHEAVARVVPQVWVHRAAAGAVDDSSAPQNRRYQ